MSIELALRTTIRIRVVPIGATSRDRARFELQVTPALQRLVFALDNMRFAQRAALFIIGGIPVWVAGGDLPVIFEHAYNGHLR